MMDKEWANALMAQEDRLQNKKPTGKVSVDGYIEMVTAISVAIIELKDEVSNLKETLPGESSIYTSGIEIEIEYGLRAIEKSIDNGFALVVEAIKNSKGEQ